MTDLVAIRRLLAIETARFCRVDEVVRAIESGPDEAHVRSLRALVEKASTSENDLVVGERTLFAAIALALVNDPIGVPVLKEPGRHYMTNSGIEVALAQIALVLLGELKPPLRFINATLIAELAQLVGAWPAR